MTCICSCRHPLAHREEVALNDLRQEPIALYAPSKAPISMVKLQGQLMGERPPSEFYFCESAEAITVLVTAGYGISILPDFLVPQTPLLAKIPLTDIDPASFGVYYKSVQGNPALKTFLSCAAECFS